MPIIVGISLRTAGKIYYFDPGTEQFYRGERVVVETSRGLELGFVKVPPCEVADEEIVSTLKPVVRHATALDVSRDAQNREREEQALRVCKRLVEKLSLPMRLIDAQYTLDGSQVLIHFLSENRVDFRELVRELARDLRTRIELRQVGVRDEAKLIGGYGICGRKLCCSSFLDDFTPVAISMAKDQGLALNPQKISGTCGRLMCCLAFECDQYRNERADMPRMNALVTTSEGVGKVTKLNVMSRMVEVSIPDAQAPIWVSADDLNGAQPARACCANTKDTAACCHGGGRQVLNAAPLNEDVTASDETSAQKKSRRRRKKRPAGQAAQQEGQPQPVTATAAAEGTAAPAKPRRKRKPRAKAEGAVAPVAVPVATGAAGGNPPEQKKVPSGRYRPRRRRPSSANGDNAPQSS